MEKEYIVFNDGENVVVKREYVKDFLEESMRQIEDEDYRSYVEKSNEYLIKEASKMNDELIGFSICAMDDWFYINQELLEEI